MDPRLNMLFFVWIMQIINSNNPDSGWVSIMAQVFVIVSVAVSFLTMGTGMQHMGKKAYFSLVNV